MPKLRLFGGAVLEGEDGLVRGLVGRRHPVALLALLATAPSRTLSRGKLVGLLWPDAPEKTARNRLTTCVHRLRKALGHDVLLSGGDGLQLNADLLWCDVVEFEGALAAGDHQRAVELHRGPFLDGFALRGSSEFEKWVDREADRLRRELRGALELLAEGAEASGDLEAAVRWWTRRASEDPYDARVAVRLMQALVAAGNRAAALRVGVRHTALLEEELGAPPGPEVRALVERLSREECPPCPTVEAPDRDRGRPESLASAGGHVADRNPTWTAANGVSVEPRRLPRRSREAAREPAVRPGTRKALLTGLVGLGVLAAGTVGVWHMLGATRADTDSDPAPFRGVRAVAVLPFELLGGEADAEDAAFARAVHTDVTNRLSALSELLVLSPSSAVAIAERAGPPPAIADEFGVEWLVRGEMERTGDGVRVTARLVDARVGRQVWGESYLAELTAENLFQIQAEIARGIADVLELRLTAEESERLTAVPTRNTTAYELYIQADEIARRAGRGPADEARLDARLGLYRRAVELDDRFAAAWARLSLMYLGRAMGSERGEPAWTDSALRAAERAARLDPQLADAHVGLAFARALHGDPDEPVASLQRAFALRPTNRTAAANLSVALVRHGRLAEALGVLERAHRLAPNEPEYFLMLANINEVLGREEHARAWSALARERGHLTAEAEARRELFLRGRPDRARVLLDSLPEPKDGDEGVATIRLRAALALYEGDWREARRLYGSLYPGHPFATSPLSLGLLWDPLGLAWSLRQLGEVDEAREIAAEVAAKADEDRPHQARIGIGTHVEHRLAVAYLLLGDTAAALDHLERSLDGSLDYVSKLETVPVLEPLRDHPRFRTFMDRLRERMTEERRRADREGWGEPPVGLPAVAPQPGRSFSRSCWSDLNLDTATGVRAARCPPETIVGGSRTNGSRHVPMSERSRTGQPTRSLKRS